MEAINSNLSFGRATAADKKADKTPKAPRPNFATMAKDAYVRTVNEKYDVDYENMKPNARKIVNKDFITEKLLCVGVAAVTLGALIGKGRNVVSGFSDAIGTSAKKILNKPGAGFDVNGKEVQGIAGWVSTKVGNYAHAPKLKEAAKAANSAVSEVISQSRNLSATRYEKAQEAVQSITKTNGLKYRAQVGETITAKNFRGVLNSIQELGEPELAARYEKQLKATPLSGEEGIKFLDSVAETLQQLGGKEGSFNATAKELGALADKVQNSQNPELAKALRGFIPEGAAEKEMISVPLSEFNKAIADNRLTAVPNASKPVEFDTKSKMHKALNKVFKDPKTVQDIEKNLGEKGIANGHDMIDTAIAGGLVLTGSDGVYKAMDDLTDRNDSEIGDSAISQSDEEELRALQAKINDKKHRFTEQEAKFVAGMAMSMV